MTFEEIRALDEQYVMPAYSRFPVAVDHGKGPLSARRAGQPPDRPAHAPPVPL